MEYTTLAGTDLRVSRICLGTMQFAGSSEGNALNAADITWGSVPQSEVNAAVEGALDAGINFFDTAEAYGGGQAEQALGNAFKTLGTARQDVVIASKFGKHPALWETEDKAPAMPYSGEMVANALVTSLSLLQMSYIDLYQIHWPGNCGMFGTDVAGERAAVSDVVAALEVAVAKGQIKHYGFCNFGTDDMAWFTEAGGRSVSNQLPYNVLWRTIERGILPDCQARGHSVLCYSSLQQGLLSGKYTDPTQLPSGRLRTRMFAPDRSSLSRHGSPGLEGELFGPGGALAALADVAEAAGCSMADLSTAWLLAQPGVSVVIVGASTAAQARRNAVVSATARSPAAVRAASEAGEAVLAAVLAQGGWVDQYAAASRIHGTEAAASSSAASSRL